MKLIDDIRAENLAALAQQMGSVKSLAEALGKSEAQVSQWINRSINSGTGKKRAMRSETARAIESALALPHGWMDQDHDPQRDEGRAATQESAPLLLSSNTQTELLRAALSVSDRWPLSEEDYRRFAALPPEGQGYAIAGFVAGIEAAEVRYARNANRA